MEALRQYHRKYIGCPGFEKLEKIVEVWPASERKNLRGADQFRQEKYEQLAAKDYQIQTEVVHVEVQQNQERNDRRHDEMQMKIALQIKIADKRFI